MRRYIFCFAWLILGSILCDAKTACSDVVAAYWLAPDGSGGTALAWDGFDGSTFANSPSSIPFSGVAASTFGGMSYDHANELIYWLAPDGFGGTALAWDGFDGNAFSNSPGTIPFSGVAPSTFGGASYDPLGQRFYWLTPDGFGGTALAWDGFDGISFANSPVSIPFSGVDPSTFGGISYDAANQTFYWLAPDGAGGTILAWDGFDGSSFANSPSFVQFSGADPSVFGGLSIVNVIPEPACVGFGVAITACFLLCRRSRHHSLS